MTIKFKRAEDIIFVGLRLDRVAMIIKEDHYAKQMLFKFLVQKWRFPETENELFRAVDKINKRAYDIENFCMVNEDDYRVEFIKMTGINMCRLIECEFSDSLSVFNENARLEAARIIKEAQMMKMSRQNAEANNSGSNTGLRRSSQTLEKPKYIEQVKIEPFRESPKVIEVYRKESDLSSEAPEPKEPYMPKKQSIKKFEDSSSKKSEVLSKAERGSQKTNEVSQKSARGVKTILSEVANFASNAKNAYGHVNSKMPRNSPPNRRTPQHNPSGLTFALGTVTTKGMRTEPLTKKSSTKAFSKRSGSKSKL